jgi:hypothetical protein
LGIQETMFHKMRSQVLQTALSRLEPRPLGRPPQLPSLEAQQIAELEDELARQRTELKAAQIRQELAEKLPRIARSAGRPGKKTTRGVRPSRAHRIARTAPLRELPKR